MGSVDGAWVGGGVGGSKYFLFQDVPDFFVFGDCSTV